MDPEEDLRIALRLASHAQSFSERLSALINSLHVDVENHFLVAMLLDDAVKDALAKLVLAKIEAGKVRDRYLKIERDMRRKAASEAEAGS